MKAVLEWLFRGRPWQTKRQLREELAARKRAEEALRESEGLYTSLVASSMDGVLLTAPDGRILTANAAACRILGRSERELIQVGRSGVVDTSDPRLAPALEERARTGRFRGELTFVRKDGTKFPCEISSAIFSDRHGELRTSMVIRDVTERKRAEEKLSRYDARLALALETGQIGFFDADLVSGVFASDPQARAILGLPEGSLTPEAAEALIHPDDRARVDAAVARAREADVRAEFVCENRIVRPDGQVRWVSSLGRATFDDTAQPPLAVGFIGVVQDITERKRTEEALRESEHRFRVLVECSAVANFVDIDGRFAYVNPAALRLFSAKTPDQLLGKPVLERIHPDFHEIVRERIRVLEEERRQVPVLEEVYLRLDGSPVPVEVTAAPITYQGGHGSVVFVRDISARKRAQEEVVEQQQRLRALAAELAIAEQRERRRVAALLHDETIQSLALAKIRLGAVARSVAPGQPATMLEEIRTIIDQTIESLRSLTYQLSPPVLHELGLEPALDWLADQFGRQHGLRCRFQDDGNPKVLDEDVRTLLFMGVRELLLNVVKHARATRASVLARKEGENMQISVEDDGAGFDPSRRPGGAGMAAGFGLFNLRERLAQAGGRCEIDAAPGRGTKVVLIAPLKRG